MRVFSVILLIILTSFVFKHPKPKADKTDEYLLSMLKKYKIPGAAICVIKDQKIIKRNNYGTYSIEFDLPVTDSSIFPLASVTKLFTSTVIMKLIEEGKLSLDDPITRFIDSLPGEWQQIKIKHLLSHTSGIVNHFMTKKARNESQDNQAKNTIESAILLSATEPLRFTPGDKYSYSVTGYMCLGLVAEKVTGKPIEQVAKEILFTPLKMYSTEYGDYKAVIKNRNSLVYTYQNGPFETWNFTYGTSGTTAAGLNSTTLNLSKFFIALGQQKILTKEIMKKMMSPTILNDGKEVSYGLGWALNKNKEKISYGHEGGGCAWIDYYPEDNLTVIVLSNLTGSKGDEIVKGIANFYLEKK